jgi:putative hydrolase of the HAD superfamily
MDIRALLFDVNGTLIDIETDEGLEEVYRTIAHFLTYQGILMRRGDVREQYFQIMNRQRLTSQETYEEWNAIEVWREILQRNASDYTRSLPAEKLQQLPLFLAELHRAIARKRLKLYPQVREVLDQLRSQYLLAVVTDAQSAYAVAELHAVGLLNYFNPVIVSGDYGYRKPDVRLFQRALDALHVKADQALFIGNDMQRDIFGPQQLNIKTIFSYSNQGEKHFQDVKPDYIIYQFSELLQAVKFFEMW